MTKQNILLSWNISQYTFNLFSCMLAGKRGVYTTSSGLKIGYLSGHQSPEGGPSEEESMSRFCAADCSAVRDACLRGQPEYRGLDILITAQWPNDVQNLDDKKVTIQQTQFFCSCLTLLNRLNVNNISNFKISTTLIIFSSKLLI